MAPWVTSIYTAELAFWEEKQNVSLIKSAIKYMLTQKCFTNFYFSYSLMLK